MTRAFLALALRAIARRARDVRSAIHGSAVERHLLAKAPVLILSGSNNKNGPQGPDFAIGRGRGIRTPDIQLPKLALYQTELYPDAIPADIRGRGQQWYGAVRTRVNAKRLPQTANEKAGG